MSDLSSSTKESDCEERLVENSIYSLYGGTSTTLVTQPTSTGEAQALSENTYDVVEPLNSNTKEGG